MKLKTTVSYYLRNSVKALLVYYGILLAIYIFSTGLSAITNSEGTVYGSGVEIITAAFIFIFGLCSWKDELHFFLQNSVSRRTIYISYFINLGFVCAAASICQLFLDFIFRVSNSVSGAAIYSSIFEMIYQERSIFTGILSEGIVNFFWDLVLFLAAGAVGYFLSNLYYFFNKMGKIIFSICFWGGIAIVYPTIDSYMDFTFSLAISRIMSFAMGMSNGNNPIYFIFSGTVFAVVFAACTWLMVRRARVKKE